MMRRLCAAGIGLLIAAATASSASAGDANGNYIVRGIGARACADYLKAADTSPGEVRPYLFWMEGYLSGLNRLQPQTVDVSPVVDTAPIGLIVKNYCQTNPQLKFETAIARIMKYLSPYRIEAQSQMVQVTLGDATAAIRQSTLKWMQGQLQAQGLMKAAPDGLFGAPTREALVAYQKANKLKETGVPDVDTLTLMIQKASAAAGASGKK